METVLITGGTGMIGQALTSHLTSRGFKVIILTRKKRPPKENITYCLSDVDKAIIDEQAVGAADHIIHLAGEGIADKRWTKKRKKQIVESRVKSGHLIISALQKVSHHVKTIVCASGIGWYGPDRKDKRPFIEQDPHSNDFLGITCKAWQDSLLPAEEMGIRTVFLRTGIVLANEGGAFKEFLKPLKAGVATIFGDGEQSVSWIHIDDICRMYIAAIDNEHMRGAYNAAAPEVVTNRQLMLKLAKARNRRFIPIHVPEFMLKAVLGELSIELLKSTTVDDSKVRNAGFNFTFPTIDAALNHLLHVS